MSERSPQVFCIFSVMQLDQARRVSFTTLHVQTKI